ncbi:unnamed protein product [Closterium sp. Naga37s-1]|nr:unnamed protein product [Closterium sp. Naga37s-1]
MSENVTESDAGASAALASSGAARRIAVRLLIGAGGSGNLGGKLSGSGGSGNFAALSGPVGTTSGVTSVANSRRGERSIASETPVAGGGSPDSLAGWVSNPKDTRRRLPQKSVSESVERGTSSGTTGRKGQASAWEQCDDLMVDWLGSVAECGSSDEAGGPAGGTAQVAGPRRGAQSAQQEGRAGGRGASGAQEERERQRERSGVDRRNLLFARERETIPRVCSDEIAPRHLSRTNSCIDHPRPELVATKEELITAKEERDALAKEMEALLESLSASPPADVANTGMSAAQQQQQQQRVQQAEEEARQLQLLLETAMAERDMAVRLAAATGRLPAGLIPSSSVGSMARSSSDEPSPRLRFTPLDVRFRTSTLNSRSNSPSPATSSSPFSPSMNSYSPSASFSPSAASFSPSSFSPSSSLTNSPSCLSPAGRPSAYAPSPFRSHSESSSGNRVDTIAKSWLGAEPAGQPRHGMMRSSSRGLVTSAIPSMDPGSPSTNAGWRGAANGEVHVGKGHLRRTSTAGGAIEARRVLESRSPISMSRPGSADIGAMQQGAEHAVGSKAVEKGAKKGGLKGILSRKSKQVRWSYDFDQEGGL